MNKRCKLRQCLAPNNLVLEPSTAPKSDIRKQLPQNQSPNLNENNKTRWRNGEQPRCWVGGTYICEVCEKDCGYYNNLRMHRKRKHGLTTKWHGKGLKVRTDSTLSLDGVDIDAGLLDNPEAFMFVSGDKVQEEQKSFVELERNIPKDQTLSTLSLNGDDIESRRLENTGAFEFVNSGNVQQEEQKSFAELENKIEEEESISHIVCSDSDGTLYIIES